MLKSNLILKIYLEWWLSIEGNFASQGTFRDVWRHLSQPRGECYWYLVGRGEECCWVSCSAQDKIPEQRIIWPQTSVMLLLRNSVSDFACKCVCVARSCI